MYILQKEKNILKKQSMVLLKLKHWKATKHRIHHRHFASNQHDSVCIVADDNDI